MTPLLLSLLLSSPLPPGLASTPGVLSNPPPPKPTLRILVEVGSGIITLGAATGVGIAISRATCSDCSFAGLGGAVVGFGAGLALAPLAVWGSGQLVDGRSHLGGAYAGALAGYALAGGTLALGTRGDSDSLGFQLAWVAASIFAVAGPVVGSELLSRPKDGRAAWAPTAWSDGRGGWVFGGVGRFD
ncbi:MAG: hypothetical protein AAFZ18_38080 [Myxococcota bacterium]